MGAYKLRRKNTALINRVLRTSESFDGSMEAVLKADRPWNVLFNKDDSVGPGNNFVMQKTQEAKAAVLSLFNKEVLQENDFDNLTRIENRSHKTMGKVVKFYQRLLQDPNRPTRNIAEPVAKDPYKKDISKVVKRFKNIDIKHAKIIKLYNDKQSDPLATLQIDKTEPGRIVKLAEMKEVKDDQGKRQFFVTKGYDRLGRTDFHQILDRKKGLSYKVSYAGKKASIEFWERGQRHNATFENGKLVEMKRTITHGKGEDKVTVREDVIKLDKNGMPTEFLQKNRQENGKMRTTVFTTQKESNASKAKSWFKSLLNQNDKKENLRIHRVDLKRLKQAIYQKQGYESNNKVFGSLKRTTMQYVEKHNIALSGREDALRGKRLTLDQQRSEQRFQKRQAARKKFTGKISRITKRAAAILTFGAIFLTPNKLGSLQASSQKTATSKKLLKQNIRDNKAQVNTEELSLSGQNTDNHIAKKPKQMAR